MNNGVKVASRLAMYAAVKLDGLALDQVVIGVDRVLIALLQRRVALDERQHVLAVRRRVLRLLP